MNKITLFVASLMLATSATKASEIINFSGSNVEFSNRFNADEPIQFSEKGIDFLTVLRREIQLTKAHLNDNGILSQEESASMISGLQKLLTYLENSSN